MNTLSNSQPCVDHDAIGRMAVVYVWARRHRDDLKKKRALLYPDALSRCKRPNRQDPCVVRDDKYFQPCDDCRECVEAHRAYREAAARVGALLRNLNRMAPQSPKEPNP